MINEGNNSVAEIDLDTTNDSDLIELGGYHAYKNYNKSTIEGGVNGKEFRSWLEENDGGFTCFSI